MSRQFYVVIERDAEGYYVASVPEIPACHSQARSLDEVTQRIREAIALCLEVERRAGTGARVHWHPAYYHRSMSRSPRVTGPELISALGNGDFSIVRIKGSHHFLRHQDGRCTVIPSHSGGSSAPPG